MTQPDGLFPESAFNFDSLAALAATPQEDWEDQMRGRSTNGFELVRQALFGVLPEDLREGIEFTRALITAIVRQLLNLPGHVWDSAEDALEAITAWIGDLADQVVTFIYNVAGIDLSSWDAFIDSLNDGKGIDLPNLLGPNSPLNAANIFGKLFPRNISGLSLSQLVTSVENELEGFISAESVPNVDGWSFDSTVGTPGSAKVVADGTLKTLYGDLIAVSPDQPVDTEIKVQYSGVTSGAGQTIRYVLELFEDSQGLVPASPATRVVGGVTSPSGSGGPVTLGGSPWDPTAGVVSVRPVLIVDSVVTAGSVWWHGPKLEKPLDSLLSGGLGAAIQARINEFQSILDAFKDGVGGVIDDVVDRIQNLVPGTGLFDASALSNITNIPMIAQARISGLVSALSNLDDFIQDVIDAIISAIRNVPFVGGTIADIITDLTGLRETADEANDTANQIVEDVNAGWTGGTPSGTPTDVFDTITQIRDAVGAVYTIEVLTTSGTWTNPGGLLEFFVICIGSGRGGGGGGRGTTTTHRGPRGLGGGYRAQPILPADLPSSVAYTIPAGGAGAAGTSSTGGATSSTPGSPAVFGSLASSSSEATASIGSLLGYYNALDSVPGDGGFGGCADLNSGNGFVGVSTPLATGGTAGTGNSNPGGTGGTATLTGPTRCGGAGGGGGSAGSGGGVNGGNGGAGGFPGGGGGGGGASGSNTGGNGGNGGNGVIILIYR